MWFVLPRTPVCSPLTPPQIFSRERRLGAIFNQEIPRSLLRGYLDRIGKFIFPVPEVPVLKDERGG